MIRSTISCAVSCSAKNLSGGVDAERENKERPPDELRIFEGSFGKTAGKRRAVAARRKAFDSSSGVLPDDPEASLHTSPGQRRAFRI